MREFVGLMFAVLNMVFAAFVAEGGTLRFLAIMGWFCAFCSYLVDLMKWVETRGFRRDG